MMSSSISFVTEGSFWTVTFSVQAAESVDNQILCSVTVTHLKFGRTSAYYTQRGEVGAVSVFSRETETLFSSNFLHCTAPCFSCDNTACGCRATAAWYLGGLSHNDTLTFHLEKKKNHKTLSTRDLKGTFLLSAFHSLAGCEFIRISSGLVSVILHTSGSVFICRVDLRGLNCCFMVQTHLWLLDSSQARFSAAFIPKFKWYAFFSIMEFLFCHSADEAEWQH